MRSTPVAPCARSSAWARTPSSSRTRPSPSDAVAVEDFERAIERAARYREAGADMLFVEAPKTRDQLARITATLAQGGPLMANMVEGGKTPVLPAAELEAIGFALVIFPGGIVRTLAR